MFYYSTTNKDSIATTKDAATNDFLVVDINKAKQLNTAIEAWPTHMAMQSTAIRQNLLIPHHFRILTQFVNLALKGKFGQNDKS